MTSHCQPTMPLPSRARRAVCAGAGFLAGGLLTTAVAALFGAASSTPWLPATPEALARAAACDQQASRQARDRCMRDTQLAWAAHRQHDLHVAVAR